MKYIVGFAIILLAIFIFTGGLDNIMTRQLGGSMDIDLPLDQKLVNVTWKEADLWILTRDVLPGEDQHKYLFYEKSALGLAEGTVTLQEHISLKMRGNETINYRIVDTLTLPSRPL